MNDTPILVQKKMIQLMRDLPGEKKLSIGLSMMDTGRAFVMASLGMRDFVSATPIQKEAYVKRLYGKGVEKLILEVAQETATRPTGTVSDGFLKKASIESSPL